MPLSHLSMIELRALRYDHVTSLANGRGDTLDRQMLQEAVKMISDELSERSSQQEG